MSSIKMRPSSVTQVKAKTSSGLQGKHFKAIRRGGSVHNVNTRDQDDPKYFHLWENLDNLKSGKMTQCGHTNAYTCTTKVEHGIGGYRNICPIGGVTGTYTQPSPITLHFDTKSHGINDDTKITKVKLSFKHQSITANVANNTTYKGVAPNFSGYSTYKNRKVVTVTFNGVTKEYNTNPPFGSYNEISFTFDKDTTGKALRTNPIVIKYGNNLADDAGILYIDDLVLHVDYVGKKPYIIGKQNGNSVYTAEEDGCKTPITFTLETGWKEGSKVVAPYDQQDKITWNAPPGVNVSLAKQSDKKTVIATLTDSSMVAGTKTVVFTLTTNKQQVSFNFQTTVRQKPTITLPAEIEKNVVRGSLQSIIANNGCTKSLKAYADSIAGQSYEFTDLQINNSSNIVSSQDIDGFYTFLQGLSCKDHDIYIQRGGEPFDKMVHKVIKVSPTKYNIEAYYNEKEVSGKIRGTDQDGLLQDKQSNDTFELRFIKGEKQLINNPEFLIINPTFGKEEFSQELNRNVTTRQKVDNLTWTPSKEGGSTPVTIGKYYPGDFQFVIDEPNNCNNRNQTIDVSIIPDHKQSFDSIFVRGEGSTAFDYDYLVALEGDNVQEPIYVDGIALGDSYKDIEICAQRFKILRIGENGYIQFSLTNNTSKTLKNIFLELNLLQKDENDNYVASTDEWIDEGGMFSSIEEKFKDYNRDIEGAVSLKNLSPDSDEEDEENVYLHIRQLNPQDTIKINLPFGSYMEREVFLQFLLFEEPLNIYDCGANSTFDLIHLQVFDSILTDISITGDLDLLSISEKNCPFECFKTEEEGITYSVKNVDSSDVEGIPTFIIDNDPRLVPYKIKYQSEEHNVNNRTTIENGENLPVSIIYGEKEEHNKCRGIKVECKINFPNYPEQIVTAYTDSNSEATFFIENPKALNITYDMETFYTDVCSVTTSDKYTYNFINNHIKYPPGQIIPLKIRADKIDKILENKIIFYPDIIKAGTSDSLTVYYKICNLPDNQGKLKTVFETKTDEGEYNLVPNKVEEMILCGIKTQLLSSFWLEKVIVENKTYNRLYMKLVNAERFNRDIEVIIKEDNTDEINKYKYISHNIDVGELNQEEDTLTWTIPYIKADTKTIGTIDFEAEEIGLSSLDIEVKDFLSDTNIVYGVQCECRKR